MDRRHFLTAAAATLVAPATAYARAPLDGEAQRRGADLVELDWSAKRLAATVRVSADPDARPAAMRVLRAGIRGGRTEAVAPVSPRPYFLVSTVDGGQVRLAERLLPLQGGRNFRDLGGYRAAGGRQVRWGRIYRSGVMSGLTPADMSYLSDVGVRVVCDLRSVQERSSKPNAFLARPTGGKPHVVATDYDMFEFDALHRATTREAALEAFAETYVTFSQALAPQYADMFDRLAQGEAPLAVNCSAGKDRTGMASAMILTALGAPRETVIADYALTQVYSPSTDLRRASNTSGMGISQVQAAAFTSLPPEVLAVIGGSDPEIMRRALQKIDARFGGPLALARAKYGLTTAKVERLRALYLI